ncbi:MAG: type I-U CRISPR-associated protein Cas5/Cas6 [Planctomycetales bacterium]|nr:type I-U CRISPR-associated protein Cas5/Cas6 [Planctomycetales bacterium]
MMWAIGVKYLRGVCVATDSGQWAKAEWPPHASRLFMALAATYFETVDEGNKSSDERRALEWLETQQPPRVFASDASMRVEHASRRAEPVTVFVPVNDSTRADQLFADSRSRQPRHFPTSIPDDDEVFFMWKGNLPEDVRSGLQRLATNVSRVGHSSSLVQVWLEADVCEDRLGEFRSCREEWQPTEGDSSAERHFRVVAKAEGMLRLCEDNYNRAGIEAFVDLEDAIKAAKGKNKKELKDKLEAQFPDGTPRAVGPPNPLSVGYARVDGSKRSLPTSVFDDDMMILSIAEGPSVSLESTLQIAGALRKRIHDAFPDRKSPAWLSGHEPDGSPTERPHLAILPLPFVGRRHADGHLLGIALAFPRDISVRDRGMALRSVFEEIDDGDESIRAIRLDLRNYRRLRNETAQLQLVREDRLTPPLSLRASSWTRACSVWETVTPIALDRFPKKDRNKERAAWRDEVAGIISQSCVNVGLPEPWQVHVHHNAFLEGAPKALPKSGGFPLMPTAESGTRFQVHARVEFAEPVVGPITLGAGRFVGYGFCRPNFNQCRARREQQ